MIITSTSNSQIKLIRKLRDRKTRYETGVFYIEGLRIVGQAMEQGANIQSLVVSPQLLASKYGSELVDSGRKRGIPIIEVSKDVFINIALKEGPQGIAAVVNQSWTSLDEIRLTENAIWVALDSPQDPGNVGTILRTLDSVGGDGLILLDSATDPHDPTAVRASMGSIFNLKLVKTGFKEFAEWKQREVVPVIGTSGSADIDYHYTNYPSPLILLMGSERMGLQEHHISICNQMVRIPMVGKSDSLNLAVSTSLVLYEIFNQQRDNCMRKDSG